MLCRGFPYAEPQACPAGTPAEALSAFATPFDTLCISDLTRAPRRAAMRRSIHPYRSRIATVTLALLLSAGLVGVVCVSPSHSATALHGTAQAYSCYTPEADAGPSCTGVSECQFDRHTLTQSSAVMPAPSEAPTDPLPLTSGADGLSASAEPAGLGRPLHASPLSSQGAVFSSPVPLHLLHAVWLN